VGHGAGEGGGGTGGKGKGKGGSAYGKQIREMLKSQKCIGDAGKGGSGKGGSGKGGLEQVQSVLEHEVGSLEDEVELAAQQVLEEEVRSSSCSSSGSSSSSSSGSSSSSSSGSSSCSSNGSSTPFFEAHHSLRFSLLPVIRPPLITYLFSLTTLPIYLSSHFHRTASTRQTALRLHHASPLHCTHSLHCIHSPHCIHRTASTSIHRTAFTISTALHPLLVSCLSHTRS
jgi:hypothetical protein